MDVFHTTYRELSDDEKNLMIAIKDCATELYNKIEAIPDGREKAVAKTKLEESVMWAVKGLTK